MSLEWHPHYDVWALIISLIIFFEYTTNNNDLKKPKRKFWYSGLIILWIFTDWPLHDIGEKYLFSVHSVEHLVLALVSPPLLLLGLHSAQKKLISIKPFISILKITSKPVFAFFLFNFVMVGMQSYFSLSSPLNHVVSISQYVGTCYWFFRGNKKIKFSS